MPLKPALRLRTDMPVELWRHKPDDEDAPSKLTIEVLFEDERVLALHKPAGLVIHPTSRHLYRTVTAWLKLRYGTNWPRPCHRLDGDTSGVLICAKSKAFERHMKIAFSKSQVKKSYIAIIHGELVGTRTVNTPLALQGKRGLVRIKMVPDPEGQHSLTNFEGLRYDPALNLSLVACFPKTGRQHQIRAHLSSIGHPIVGDKLYGFGDAFFDSLSKNPSVQLNANGTKMRHALHANRIAFDFEGKHHDIVCRPPNDFFKVTQLAKDGSFFCTDVAQTLGSS